MPSRFLLTIASSDDSTIAASRCDTPLDCSSASIRASSACFLGVTFMQTPVMRCGCPSGPYSTLALALDPADGAVRADDSIFHVVRHALGEGALDRGEDTLAILRVDFAFVALEACC